MRDQKRIPRILKLVGKVWRLNPDWRLGQLISNLLGPGPQDVFYFEDDSLEMALERGLEAYLAYAALANEFMIWPKIKGKGRLLSAKKRI
jgi:hypothetical protein